MYFLFPYSFPVYVQIPIYPYIYPANRQYPPTNQEILSHSVEEYQILMQQGEILLNALSNPAYAQTLMEEAQQDHQAEVDQMLQSIEGLHVPVDITYTPSGIIFNLQSPAASKGANCCTLNMTLKWGD